jgi:MEDS: MEthanogen/methylotroph, DcmR Sensory domain
MAERNVPLRGSAHVFHAYDDVADAIRAAGAFLAQGRAARDVCMFFGDDPMATRLAASMGPSAAPAFRHIHPASVFRASKQGVIGTLLQLRDHAVASAIAGGHHARFVIVPSADATDRELWERTDAFESMFTGHRATGAPLSALCLYDRARFSPDLLELADVAHPCELAADSVRQNPRFAPPRIHRVPGVRAGRVA